MKPSLKVLDDGSTEFFTDKEEYEEYYKKSLIYKFDEKNNVTFDFEYI